MKTHIYRNQAIFCRALASPASISCEHVSAWAGSCGGLKVVNLTFSHVAHWGQADLASLPLPTRGSVFLDSLLPTQAQAGDRA